MSKDGIDVLRRACANRLKKYKIEKANQWLKETRSKVWSPHLVHRDDGAWVEGTGLEPQKITAPQAEVFPIAMRSHINLNLEWGRGNGKSWFDRFSAWCWIARADGVPRHELLEQLGIPLSKGDPDNLAEHVKGVRIVFLMPTLKQFRNVHGMHFLQEAQRWAHLEPDPNRSTYQIKFPGGSWITPFPAEEYTSKRALGMRADIVIADEADSMPRIVWDSVVVPWMTEPWSLGIKVTSGVYQKGRHGLLYKRRLEAEADEQLVEDPKERKFFTSHATYRDCPALMSTDEVEEARRTLDPQIFSREYECNPDSAEGLVFGAVFDPDFHVREPPEGMTWQEILIGRDYGDEDPGCILVLGCLGHGRDAVAWVLDEVYERRRLPNWWKEQIAVRARYYARGGKPKYYPDPSRPGDNEEEAKVCGLRLQHVDNGILEGLAAVSTLFAVRERRDEKGEVTSRYARLYISPKCVNLLTELGMSYPTAIAGGQYRRKPDRDAPGKFLDDPVDKYNHAVDPLRYIIFNRFGTPTRK
jgi:hypothetical protein